MSAPHTGLNLNTIRSSGVQQKRTFNKFSYRVLVSEKSFLTRDLSKCNQSQNLTNRLQEIRTQLI